MTTDADVAKWMKQAVDSNGMLFQEIAVHQIQQQFGAAFVYINDAGNMAISKTVLREFKKISADTVVWERGERMWRQRQPYDLVGRRQAD